MKISPPTLLSLLLLSVLFAHCKSRAQERELIVFHAGSLAVPFRAIARGFERENPGVRVRLEAAGSRVCARKISELHRRADILASADDTVIDTLLIPEHASYNIRFAGNEMVVAYGAHSRVAGRISSHNWYRVLLEKGVAFGRSDPNGDPCGYRAIMVMKLAEAFYGEAGLAARLRRKDRAQIRPKETDLLALLEAKEIDALFIYRSVAIQHNLPHVVLPDEINLKRQEFASHYGGVAVEISGKRPGTRLTKRGAPMVYGVTSPRSAPHPRLARRFLRYLLDRDRGLKILKEMGQEPLVPAPTTTFGALPKELRGYARPR